MGRERERERGTRGRAAYSIVGMDRTIIAYTCRVDRFREEKRGIGTSILYIARGTVYIPYFTILSFQGLDSKSGPQASVTSR